MKMFLSFVCGAVVMLGFNAMRGANPSHHVYELRMYHVNQGKTEALQARFRDYTDALFKRHNMKSVGYWVPVVDHNDRYFMDPTSYSWLN
jgi:hypothetical protein